MKTIYYILFTFFLLNSCVKKEDFLRGHWIEKENLINPTWLEFGEDYYTVTHYGELEKKLYKIKKDTFIYESGMQIEKLKFKVKEGRLSFYSINNDSLLSEFEKTENGSFIDFFNKKKNTLIELPQVEAKKLGWWQIKNTVFCDYKNDELLLFLNGERHTIDSLSFIGLLEKPEDIWSTRDRTLILCDKGVTLKDFNSVRTELRKGFIHRVTYVTQYDKSQLLGIQAVLPMMHLKHLPDSLENKYPPQPPSWSVFDIEDFKMNNLLCLVSEKGKVLNGNHISDTAFYTSLSDCIQKKKKLVLHIHFDENQVYEQYLLELSKIRNIYYSIRTDYSKKKFNVDNYEDLDLEAQKEIKKLFPMRLREIDKIEYEQITNYALEQRTELKSKYFSLIFLSKSSCFLWAAFKKKNYWEASILL